MLEREDGPVKHYYLVCDGCGKQTRRQAYEYNMEDAPKGWTEVEDELEEYTHYCPKCSKSAPADPVTEVVAKVEDGIELSDHDGVSVGLTRKAANELVIDTDGVKWVITSASPIKVEQHDE